ncbi:MAG: hypothetical protein ABEJ83_03665 [Candidatus Nanohaloarchaea archaeon]
MNRRKTLAILGSALLISGFVMTASGNYLEDSRRVKYFNEVDKRLTTIWACEKVETIDKERLTGLSPNETLKATSKNGTQVAKMLTKWEILGEMCSSDLRIEVEKRTVKPLPESQKWMQGLNKTQRGEIMNRSNYTPVVWDARIKDSYTPTKLDSIFSSVLIAIGSLFNIAGTVILALLGIKSGREIFGISD